MRICPVVLLLLCTVPGFAQSYLGFDKNGYPGDDLLPALHHTFAYTGYWLNNPPGMSSNPWAGKRDLIRSAGFGFAILFNGRLDNELQGKDAAALGRSDADLAVAAAKREGFPARVVIFVDQEEGGRLLPEQLAYLGGWFAELEKQGLRPGIYCPGIQVPDGKGVISTAGQVHAQFPRVRLWVANDQCPPAPGCAVHRLPPSQSGFSDALVWQFAQSPRSQYAAGCGKQYATDGKCYAPGLPVSDKSSLDMNSSQSADPSGGR
jgi:hypothetical protein